MIDPIDISDLIPHDLNELRFHQPQVAFVPVQRRAKPARGWELDERRLKTEPPDHSDWISPGIEPEELFGADAGELAVHLLSRDMAARRK